MGTEERTDHSYMIPTKPGNLQIVLYPDPVLKKLCEPVTAFGDELQALADRMFELMREASGVGLAAPQVGVPIRMFIYDVTGEPEDGFICVNPELIDLTGAAEAEEGCLSIPDVDVIMRRATGATLQALDVHGQPFSKTGDDLLARVWQHEIDHLNGRLITDNMATTDEIANRRAIKQLEAEYASSRRA